MYVGNLPFSATENELRGLFEQFGAVNAVELPVDRTTGTPRGFAFVTMEEHGAMSSAIGTLNAKDWNGRRLSVNEARPRADRALADSRSRN